MSKNRYRTGGLLAVGLLESSVCLAETPTPYDVSFQCEQVSRQLEQHHQNAPCVENIELSALYMEAVAKNASNRKAPQTLTNTRNEPC